MKGLVPEDEETDPGAAGGGDSRWQRFRTWVSWEFGRPIELTPAIKLITVERFLKSLILIASGLALLALGSQTDARHVSDQLQDQLNLSQDSGWWGHLLGTALQRFGALSATRIGELAVGAMLYGVLEAFEGIGLLMRRRWAEYLVLVATAAFLPIEIGELIHRPSVFKAGALAVNLAIIVYLVWRKRLFLERPGHAMADRTENLSPDLDS